MWIWPHRISPSSLLHKSFLAIPFLFDLEIALLLLSLAITNNINTILIIALFLILLLAVSLAYEWTQKELEWTEWYLV